MAQIIHVVFDDLAARSFGPRWFPCLSSLVALGGEWVEFMTMRNCNPTRFALLTGREPVSDLQHGVWQAHDDRGWPANLTTIGHVMQYAGYETHFVGKGHTGYGEHTHPVNLGFDEFVGHLGGWVRMPGPIAGPDGPWHDHQYFGHSHGEFNNSPNGHDMQRRIAGQDGVPLYDPRHTTELFSDEAARMIREGGENLYLYLSYGAAHKPWSAPKWAIVDAAKDFPLESGDFEYLQDFGNDIFGVDVRHAAQVNMPDDVKARLNDVMYHAVCLHGDWELATKVLKALGNTHPDNEKMVLVHSDNGIGADSRDVSDNIWPGWKGTPLPGGHLGNAAFIHNRGEVTGERRDPISMWCCDVLPTFAGFAGVDPAHVGLRVDGADVSRALRTGTRPPNRPGNTTAATIHVEATRKGDTVFRRWAQKRGKWLYGWSETQVDGQQATQSRTLYCLDGTFTLGDNLIGTPQGANMQERFERTLDNYGYRWQLNGQPTGLEYLRSLPTFESVGNAPPPPEEWGF